MLSLFLNPILTAILGLVLIFAAEPIINVIIISFGIYLLINGINIFLTLSKLSNDKAFIISCYVRAIVTIILGIICVVMPVSIAHFAWKTLMIVIGIYSLLSCITEIYSLSKLSNTGFSNKKYIYEIVTSLITAIIAFMLPSSFGFTIIKFAGFTLLVIAIIMAINCYKNRPIIDKDAKVENLD